MSRLLQVCWVFGMASLLSFGGGSAIVPELQRQTVDEFHWLTAQEFADSFAITQVAPGPSTLIVLLIGYHAAGLPGALVATVAMVLPAAILVWLVTRSWLHTRHARWHTALERGLAPIGLGLVAASGIVISRGIDTGVGGWLITGASTAALVLTRANPLIVVTAGGVVGLLLRGA